MSDTPVQLSPEAAESPLASMVADLIGQNVAANPHKAEALHSLEFGVAIHASDLDESVTLHFRGPHGLLVDGVRDDSHVPAVVITAESSGILDLARLSLVGKSGIPILWNSVGASVARRVLAGKIRIKPVLPYLGKLTRLLKVISVADSDRP